LLAVAEPLTFKEKYELFDKAAKHFLASGGLAATSAWMFSTFPLATSPLFVPAGGILMLHPGITSLAGAVAMGILGIQHVKQLGQ
jgi:hypothetical protein